MIRVCQSMMKTRSSSPSPLSSPCSISFLLPRPADDRSRLCRPGHKAKIISSIQDIRNSVSLLDHKMKRLLGSRRSKAAGSQSLYQSSVEKSLNQSLPEEIPHDSSFLDGEIDVAVSKEDLMEEIDELVHQLQYQIDRCRRFVLPSLSLSLSIHSMAVLQTIGKFRHPTGCE